MTQRILPPAAATRRCQPFARPALACGLLALLLEGSGRADTTTVINFDPPSFAAGQVVAALPGISFPDQPVVFTPASVTTFSGPNALRSAASCEDFECTSGGWKLRMTFPQGASAVSLRAGTDESVFRFCFPEGTTCPFFARLRGYDAGGAVVADSQDVLIADSGAGGLSSIATLVSIADCAGRIRTADVVVGNEIFSFDRHPGRVQIDQLSFTVPSAPCNTRPDPPSITITSPQQDQAFDEHGRVEIWGRITAPGGVAAFCTAANQPAPPASCLQANRVRADGSFGPVYFDVARFAPGANSLDVHVQDFWGQTAHASVRVQLPPPQIDVRVVGMEVTQAVQRGGVPPNIGIPVPYVGVTLAREGKTVVRVYANRSGQGPTRQVECRLYGFLGTSNNYLDNTGFIRPDNGRRDLVAGGSSVTFDERVDPAGAYVFTLPMSWTRRGTISLRAVLNPWGDAPWVLETPGYQSNNSMDLTGIPFVYRNGVVLSPVEITWTDSSGTVNRPPAPSAVFRWANLVAPVADGGIVAPPYVGTIDVTDLVNMGLSTDDLEAQIFGRVVAFEGQNFPGVVIGVAWNLNIGLERLVYFAWPPRFEPIAVANAAMRPLTIAAHELFHTQGFYHAGTGCGPSFPSQSWPPDDRGLLDGIGLDRRPGSGGPGLYKVIASGAPGQPAEIFDLMSYCINGTDTDTDSSDAWISAHNWEAFGGSFPSGIIPADLLPYGQADYQPAGASAKPGSATLHVLVDLDDRGRATLFHVRKGEGRGVVFGPAESPYRIEARDSSGTLVYQAPMAGALHHADHRGGHYSVLSAEIPGDAVVRVRVMRDDVVVAEKLRSQNAPRVQVVSPAAGTRVRGRGDVVVRWKVEDADGDPLQARVEYSADGGTTYRVLTAGVGRDAISLPARLFRRSERARLRVVVNDGFDDGEALSELFSAEGAAPTVHIRDPQESTAARAGDALQLTGEAFDDGGQPLDGRALKWFAADRFLGTGRQAVALDLTPGPLEIRLEATDSIGRTSSESVVVQVRPDCFFEDFSGAAAIEEHCAVTPAAGPWRVQSGQLIGSTPDDREGWAWAGSPPVRALDDASYSVEIRFLSQPPTEVGRHGGIMFCATAPTSRGDPAASGYTLDWIDRAEDRGLRLLKWQAGASVVLATGGGTLVDPPVAWNVELDGPTIRFRGDGQVLLEGRDAELRGGYFGVWGWVGQEIAIDAIDFAAGCDEGGKDDLRADFRSCGFPRRWRYQAAAPGEPLHADLTPSSSRDGAGVAWGEAESVKDESVVTGIAEGLPADALLVGARRGMDNLVSWISPGPGTASVTGRAGLPDSGDCKGGVMWTIYRNDDLRSPLLERASAAEGRRNTIELAIRDVPLAAGDVLRFRASALDEERCARGFLSVRVDFRPATGDEVPAGSFRRGDVNGDGVLDISDPIQLLGFLFLGRPTELACPAAADSDDDDSLVLSDAIATLAFQFLSGPPLPEPFADCGIDPTPGILNCDEFPACR